MKCCIYKPPLRWHWQLQWNPQIRRNGRINASAILFCQSHCRCLRQTMSYTRCALQRPSRGVGKYSPSPSMPGARLTEAQTHTPLTYFHCSFRQVPKVTPMPVNVCAAASKLNRALIALCEQARQVAGDCQNSTWQKNASIEYVKFAGALNTSPSIKNDPWLVWPWVFRSQT